MKLFNQSEVFPVIIEALRVLTNCILSQKVSVAQILFIIIINILCFYVRDFIPMLVIPNLIIISVIFMINNGFYFAVFKLKQGNVSQIGCFGLQPDCNEFKGKKFDNKIFDPFSYDISEHLSNSHLKRKQVFSPVNFECPSTKCSGNSTSTLTTAQSSLGITKNLTTTTSSLNTSPNFSNSNPSIANMSVPLSLPDPLTTVVSSISTVSKPCSSLNNSMSTSVNITLPSKPSFPSSDLISTSVSQGDSDFNTCANSKSSIENIDIRNELTFSNENERNEHDVSISNFNNSLVSSLVDEIKSLTVSSHTNINTLMQISPKFNGSIKDYKSFQYKFKTLVNHLKLKDSEKALLLFSCITDGVIEALGPITVDGLINYDLLWTNLEREYNRPENGPLYYGAAFNSIASWDVCDTKEKLVNLYEFLLKNVRALEREIGVQNDLVVAATVLPKFDGLLLENAASFLSKANGKPVMSEILNLMKEEITRFELEKIVSGSHNDFEKSKVEPPKFKENILKEIDSCLFCRSSSHKSDDCLKFDDPWKFKSVLLERFLCFNCFNLNHKWYNCPENKQCNLCNDPRKHSRILCDRYFH